MINSTSSLRLRSAGSLRAWRRLAVATAAVAITALSAATAPASAGPYRVAWTEPTDLRAHTVYRPTNAPPGQKLPVLVWGNGACVANGLLYQVFLTELASNGIVVIASGGPYGVGATNVGFMERSVDWAKRVNGLVGGSLYGKLDADNIAVAGHSCGGLEAYQLAAKRPEVAAVGVLNSGQLSIDQRQLDAQHAPILYVLGGADDVAYPNGSRDFGRLPAALPAFLASSNTGHMGTYFNDRGGLYSQILKDWIFWQIAGDQTAAQRFVGASCGLCTAPGWTVRKRNIA